MSISQFLLARPNMKLAPIEAIIIRGWRNCVARAGYKSPDPFSGCVVGTRGGGLLVQVDDETRCVDLWGVHVPSRKKLVGHQRAIERLLRHREVRVEPLNLKERHVFSARVYLPDGRDAAAWLVEQGEVWADPRVRGAYRREQKAALENGRGRLRDATAPIFGRGPDFNRYRKGRAPFWYRFT
ncbi:hypothetical protein [Tranquillimonas alkanivorans]|uniref:Nuclease homologue n=1 Tax=Tranquillimonas alkanivorans TaxID=441119 RepID=A0A1I5V9F6_9RHOB|nr:hypothetical protein [Tranquillimonas alkanivorans]SFQ04129.1 hypothetical protein SAMN04488047_12832 [Tranquillimonas alkanivorans]